MTKLFKNAGAPHTILHLRELVKVMSSGPSKCGGLVSIQHAILAW